MWAGRLLEKIWFTAMCKSSSETLCLPTPTESALVPKGRALPQESATPNECVSSKDTFYQGTPLDEHM